MDESLEEIVARAERTLAAARANLRVTHEVLDELGQRSARAAKH